MKELLAVLGLYVVGAGLTIAGVTIRLGPGPGLIIAGLFVLVAAFMLSRGIARVPTD